MRFALACMCMCMCVMVLLPAMVTAVPIPYYNCGSTSDHVHITTAEADVWSVPIAIQERVDAWSAISLHLQSSLR